MTMHTLNVVSFGINYNDKPTIYIPREKNKSTKIDLKSTIYIDDFNLQNMKKMRLNRFFLRTSIKDSYISEHFINIPIEKMNETNFLNANFSFSVPPKITTSLGDIILVDHVDLLMFYALRENSKLESNRLIKSDSFFSTTIPVIEVTK